MTNNEIVKLAKALFSENVGNNCNPGMDLGILAEIGLKYDFNDISLNHEGYDLTVRIYECDEYNPEYCVAIGLYDFWCWDPIISITVNISSDVSEKMRAARNEFINVMTNINDIVDKWYDNLHDEDDKEFWKESAKK